MDKRPIVFATFLLMLSLLTSCWRQSDNGQAKDQQKQVDKFYTETGGWDWIRVPLIKPYEAKKIDPKLESSNWYISYGKIDNAINVKDVSVIDSIIYAYCGDSTLLDYKYIKAAWFIFDVKKNIKQGFSSESEFDNYLQSNNYPKPHWQDIDSISEMLGNGGQVPWMPK